MKAPGIPNELLGIIERYRVLHLNIDLKTWHFVEGLDHVLEYDAICVLSHSCSEQALDRWYAGIVVDLQTRKVVHMIPADLEIG